MKDFVDNKELFIFDGFVGADPETRLPIRVINDHVCRICFQVICLSDLVMMN